MAIDKEPLRSISFPDWSQLKSDTRAVDLQKRCDNSRSVAMFRISDSEFLFVFEGMLLFTRVQWNASHTGFDRPGILCRQAR